MNTQINTLREKCGIIGIYNPSYEHLLPIALTAAGGVQHRGQHGTGIAINTRKKILTYKTSGLIKQVSTSPIVKKLNRPSLWAMVHCRYGTFGSYAKVNLQPCIIKSKDNDTIAVIHNGEFAAVNDFVKIIKSKTKKRLAEGLSDSYLFSLILMLSEGKNWDEKVLNCLSHVKGAYSLIIGINNTLYLARDRFGIRPLIFGKVKNSWLAASETHAFSKVGGIILKQIGKGEIVKIDKNGPAVLKKETNSLKHFCEFEWAYFSRPESRYPTVNTDDKKPSSWLSTGYFRERTGITLAKEAPIPQATFVIGIPDSGISLGNGYANALKIPYRQAIVRDHYDRDGHDRLFMRDDDIRRISKKVLGKLSLVHDDRIWKDAIVVIADDSIVRGNVSRKLTKAVFSMGVKEVHWVVGYPAITHKCHLGVSIRTGEELIAARHSGDVCKIAKELGATSLHYISHTGFIKARLLENNFIKTKDPKEIFLANGGCGGCITGLYPVTQAGEYTKLKQFK